MSEVSVLFPTKADLQRKNHEEAKQIFNDMMQGLNHRHSLYHSAAGQIVSIASAVEYRKALAVYSKDFGAWQNEEFQPKLKELKPRGISGSELLPTLERAKEIFEAMESAYQNARERHIPDLLIDGLVTKFEATLSEFEKALHGVKTAQATIEKNSQDMQKSMLETLRAEVEDLKNIKRAQNLNENFGKLVTDHAKRLPWIAGAYLFSFVLVILLLAAALSLPSYFAHKEGWEWYTEVLLRISVGLPLAWLALLLYNHVRMYRASQLRYQHLDRMLTGGLTAALDFIDPAETEVRREAYRKYIELYLDISSDASALYANNPVTEESIRKALALVKDATGTVQGVRAVVQPQSSPLHKPPQPKSPPGTVASSQ